MAKRCEHQWQPLVAIDTTGMSADDRMTVAINLHRVAAYDRCTACGRLAKVVRGRRNLISNEWAAANLIEHAERVKTWLAERLSKTAGA